MVEPTLWVLRWAGTPLWEILIPTPPPRCKDPERWETYLSGWYRRNWHLLSIEHRHLIFIVCNGRRDGLIPIEDEETISLKTVLRRVLCPILKVLRISQSQHSEPDV